MQNGTYRPHPLLAVAIERPGRAPRQLAIPSVRDRVAQTAVANALAPVLEREFEDCSFGYRPSRSVDLALRRVMHYRDRGFRWVVDADKGVLRINARIKGFILWSEPRWLGSLSVMTLPMIAAVTSRHAPLWREDLGLNFLSNQLNKRGE